VPDKQLAELRPLADPDYTFMAFTGDCGPGGQVQMTGPRTCSAKFSPTAVVSVPPNLPPNRSGAGRASRGNPSGTPPPAATQPGDQAARGTVAPPPPPARGQTGSEPGAGAGRGSAQTPQAPPAEVKTPVTDEEYAKTAIKSVLIEYCHAYETIDPSAVQRVYPKVDMPTMQIQLNRSKYKSIQCKFADPVFTSLDAGAGTANLQVEVKRIYEHTAVKTGPATEELIATMAFSRPNPRSPWFIEKVQYRIKPK
jgi:hypothetical protein